MAARGNSIIISAEPQGKFLTGVVSGTPKPGVVMEIMTPFYRGNDHLWRVYQPGTDGDRRIIAVLLEDHHQGFGIGTAYVTLKQCRLYVPVAGEMLNMYFTDISGTADIAAGDMCIVDSGTGGLLASTGTPESEPFQILEAQNDPGADFMAPCIVTGQ